MTSPNALIRLPVTRLSRPWRPAETQHPTFMSETSEALVTTRDYARIQPYGVTRQMNLRHSMSCCCGLD
jgi:hypothetical protein